MTNYPIQKAQALPQQKDTCIECASARFCLCGAIDLSFRIRVAVASTGKRYVIVLLSLVMTFLPSPISAVHFHVPADFNSIGPAGSEGQYLAMRASYGEQ